MKSLLCEGPCNPPFSKGLDAAVATWRKEVDSPKDEDLITKPDDQALALFHTLVHTPHAEAREGVYMCSACLTERKF